MRKTSASHPLRVDFLPETATGLPGRIGLTLAPGKKAPGIDGDWDRDLDADLGRLVAEYETGMLVSLCEPHELRRLGIGDLQDRARAAGIQVEAWSFADGGTPPHPTWLFEAVDSMIQAANEGRNVVIHCRGGLGRSGLVAACALVARGKGAAEAMRIVREARIGAIENDRQEDFVRAFEEAWTAARARRDGD